MSFIKSHVKSAPPLSTLEKPKDPSMSVSQSTAEMRKIKIKRNHVEYTLANLDTLCKISKPLPLKKCSVKIPSFGKNESPTGSINIRQLNMEQTQDANCILLFFQKIQPPPISKILHFNCHFSGQFSGHFSCHVSCKVFTGITESRKSFSQSRQCSTDLNESFGFHLKLLVSL